MFKYICYLNIFIFLFSNISFADSIAQCSTRLVKLALEKNCDAKMPAPSDILYSRWGDRGYDDENPWLIFNCVKDPKSETSIWVRDTVGGEGRSDCNYVSTQYKDLSKDAGGASFPLSDDDATCKKFKVFKKYPLKGRGSLDGTYCYYPKFCSGKLCS